MELGRDVLLPQSRDVTREALEGDPGLVGVRLQDEVDEETDDEEDEQRDQEVLLVGTHVRAHLQKGGDWLIFLITLSISY